MTHDALVPPGQIVLEVVQGGDYLCGYGSGISVPPGRSPAAGVFLSVPGHEFDISRPWPISVTGGRAVAYAVGRPPISALRLLPDPDLGPDYLIGAFGVEVSGESAIVEMTAPLSPGGALVSATCEDQNNERLFNALVPPQRIVFEVVPLNLYSCDARARAGTVAPTVPPTETLASAPTDPSSGGWPMILVVMASVVAASLLIVARTWPPGAEGI